MVSAAADGGDVLLMTPGPVMLSERVVAALSGPARYHHDEDFVTILDRCTERLAELVDVEGLVAILPGSGRVALEAALATVLRPGDRSLHLTDGVFGTWPQLIAQRLGANPRRLDTPPGTSPSAQILDAILDAARRAGEAFCLITVAHCETSTGQLHPIADYARVCREHDVPLLVDGIASVGCVPLSMKVDGLPMLVMASQKGLGAPLGLSMAAVGEMLLARLRRTPPPRTWVFDLLRWVGFRDAPLPRPYPVVPSPHLVEALEASLVEIEAEGLEARFERHRRAAAATRAALTALGCRVIADRPSPSVTAVELPPGLSAGEVVEALRRDERIRVASGMGRLADRVLRVGHMGRQAQAEPLWRTIDGLGRVLTRFGQEDRGGSPRAAFEGGWSAAEV